MYERSMARARLSDPESSARQQLSPCTVKPTLPMKAVPWLALLSAYILSASILVEFGKCTSTTNYNSGR